MKTVLVSGVSPKVGKTVVLDSLQAYWQRFHGAESVEQMVLPTLTPDAIEQQMEPDMANLWRSLCQTQQATDLLLIEGEGSLSSPVTRDTTLATLAKEWRLPVLLVVPVAWEAIAPTVATISLAREANLTLAGLILNQHQTSPNITAKSMADSLQSLTHAPTLGVVPFMEQPQDDNALANLASELMLDIVVKKLTKSA
ncbi:MAG: ATP-dependent dethiobiotin synthetase BioD [Cyanobacteria bacterium P01_F01_bin.150]